MEDYKNTKTKANKYAQHPYAAANIFSKLFFTYLFSLFREGFKRELTENDLFPTLEAHHSTILGNKLETEWNREMRTKKHPSLWKALYNVFAKELAILGFFLLIIELLVKLAQPLALAQLLKYYDKNSAVSKNEAYIYAFVIVASSLITAVFQHTYYMLNLFHLGMKIRVATSTLVYRKALRLSKSAMTGTTVGQMVNLITNDVGRFELTTTYIHNLWLAPMETIIVLVLLYLYVGPSGLAGVLLLLFFIPFQMWMGKRTSVYRLKTALKTDERIRVMNEIITDMQVIKFYTWEQPFAKLVEFTRRQEIEQIKNISIIRAIMMSFNLFLNRTAIYLCVLTYVATGNILNAQYVFVVTSFYDILKIAVTMSFPQGVAQLAESDISVKRIREFLLYDEVENLTNEQSRFKAITGEDNGIKLENVSAKWNKSQTDFNVEDITMQVGRKELAVVIGPVGCGKSTLLHVILKELTPNAGAIKVNGVISYASQEPWLFSGSIRQNILFGEEFKTKRYEDVIRVCALERDFDLMPYGDRTLVGERGVALSGGQRARINLARAVYKDADIYLLDDPLSAVDAQVGRQLFEKCITGYLKEKCVVLVTHQLQYLREVEKIYPMSGGQIGPPGSLEKIQHAGKAFVGKLEETEFDGMEENTIDKLQVSPQTTNDTKTDEEPVEEKEGKEEGTVSFNIYKAYISASGHWLTIVMLVITFIVAQTFGSLCDYYLTWWVNGEQLKEEPTAGINILSPKFWLPPLTPVQRLAVYTMLISAVIVLTISRSLWFYRICMIASVTLHNEMFNKIVRATMRFFNVNPSGRILNRFSKDMNQVDEILPITFLDTIQVGLNGCAITIVVTSINPWMLLPALIVLAIFYAVRTIFLATSRDIKRLEAIMRSPVYSHFTASLQGLTTIRAFGAQNVLNQEFDYYQNRYSSAYFMFLVANRSFGFYLDVFCVVFIGLVTFSFLVMNTENLSGDVGLAITQSVMLTGMLQWGMKQWSELEVSMTCVERIKQYSEITTEKDEGSQHPSEMWPSSGKIQFCNLSLRYDDNQADVLKGISFLVGAKEKVGMVGRTGAGKSSLVAALFRLAETSGSIFIDDIDTKCIPLKTLRSRISIIPQEPVLFSDTLRKNLDPFDEFNDQTLWDALEDVELKSVVSDLPHGMQTKMAERGANFSVGQRQLLCLARAIIRNNKILVLDEATANVDPNTDGLIQSTIRKKFSECTVLTIAHRLNTIMDSEKVLVLDAGEVVEYGQPYKLLMNRNIFYDMVQQTGKTMAQNLRTICEQAYETRDR
ncbi:probable multidrug resistance-associated protein lethal(2)03659 isoform X2 [Cylas formicarius]|nr:probable multidrug resistance-associated protein lethal(2)03659 isoform X2 [Cylas formicarius]XP_060518773.1 probable multidrug resistance-associated protein lethal(2)03659 isoform X2 [Cylas formicarius]XP_060518774.1 probable multidrug resistance-associated protein lethal(2)03659 isoform X2 [Cylas formicarius]